jgi:hypothetical protein
MPKCEHYIDGLCSTITICHNKGKFSIETGYHVNGIKYSIYGVCESNGEI